jgi:hypothetical protein
LTVAKVTAEVTDMVVVMTATTAVEAEEVELVVRVEREKVVAVMEKEVAVEMVVRKACRMVGAGLVEAAAEVSIDHQLHTI